MGEVSMNESKEDPVKFALGSFLPLIPEGPSRAEELPLLSARGRILAGAIAAPMDSPPYARSIIEGYLSLASDVSKASPESPVTLQVAGEVALGAAEAGGLAAGKCLSVTTGSFIPPGDVTVVRRWDVERKGDRIVVTRPAKKGDNIEERGCDQKKGDRLLPKGKRLAPQDLYLLAAHGIVKVPVSVRPRVAIFSSGNEVIPAEAPMRTGYIRDCNAVGLSAQVEEAGGSPLFKGIMKDDFDVFLAAVIAALNEADMVVISGGTAVGGRDFIADLIGAAGKPGTVVNGVPMRSGKPIVLGVAGTKPLVCVAGHPPEAARGFNLFGRPALSRLLGEVGSDIEPQLLHS
jgi:molybdopterin molybdotransferase